MAAAVQDRLEHGEELPGVRAVLQEFGALAVMLEVWRSAEDERWNTLVDELSNFPLLIADRLSEVTLEGLNPHFATLQERLARIETLLQSVAANQDVLSHEFPPIELPGGLLSVFVSSVMSELRDERRAAADALASLQLVRPWLFEQEPPSPLALPEAYLRYVRTCDILLLIVGSDVTDPVMTEYETALALQKPILALFKITDVVSEKVRILRQQIQAEALHKYAEFDGLEQLTRHVRESVALTIVERFRDRHTDEERRGALLVGASPEILLAEYRAELAQQTAYLDLSGIPYFSPAPLPVETLYMSRRLVAAKGSEETVRQERSDTATWIRHVSRRRRLDRRQLQATLGQRRFARGYDPQNALDAEGLIALSRPFVVLGEAGIGKSTLLRFLAHRLSASNEGLVPVLVSLGAFARSDRELSLADYAFAEASAPWGDRGPDLKAALSRAMQEGRMVLLLDGLDETGEAQADVAKAVLSVPHWESRPILITSRPDAYWRTGKSSALGKSRHYELQPLEPVQILSFARAWFTAMAIAFGQPDSWADDRASWFEQQLIENPLVQEVAGNPLMLIFLVVLTSRAVEAPSLPTRRHDLYLQFVEASGPDKALLPEWERHKDPQRTSSVTGLTADEIDHAFVEGLSVIGWELHRGFFGTHPENVYWASLAASLARDYEVAWGMTNARAQVLANQTLRFWVGAGLLLTHDAPNGKALSFRHLTLQEFAASRYLLRLWQDAPDRIPWQSAGTSSWQEVFALAAGGLIDATLFIQSLLAAGDRQPLEKHLHLQMLTAAACLAESAQADPHLEIAIIQGIYSLFSLDIHDLSTEVTERLVRLGRGRLGALVSEVLLRGIHDSDTHLRYGSMATFASMGAPQGEVLGAFIEFVDSQADIDGPKGIIRWSPESELLPKVVKALGSCKPPDERAHAALYKLSLKPRVTFGLMNSIIDSLRAQGRSDLVEQIESVRTLHKALSSLRPGDDNERAFLTGVAAALVSEELTGSASYGEDISALRQLFTLLQLEDWPSEWVSEIARTGIDASGSTALHIALRLLGLQPDILAAQATMVATDVRPVWSRELWDPDEEKTAAPDFASVQSLQTDEIALLITALNSRSEWVSFSARILLSQAGPTEELYRAVSEAIMVGPEAAIRRWAAAIPEWMEGQSPEVAEALLIALQTDAEPAVRAAAARSLARYLDSGPAVTSALVAALHDAYREVRANAADSLSAAKDADGQIVDALVHALDTSEPPGKCGYCGSEIPPESDTCPTCKIQGTTSRAAIIEAIGRVAPPSREVVELLAEGLRGGGFGETGMPYASARGIAAMWAKYPSEATEIFVGTLLGVTKTADRLRGLTHALELTAKAIAASAQASSSLPIEQLLPLLDHPSGPVRRAVVTWLGRLESDVVVIPALVGALDDPQIRDEAYAALRLQAESQLLADDPA